MKEIDCLGEICPVPIIKLRDQLTKRNDKEPILIITDHSCAAEAIKNLCLQQKLTIEENEVIQGVWEITVT